MLLMVSVLLGVPFFSVIIGLAVYGNYQSWKYDREMDKLSDEAIDDLDNEAS